MAFMKGNVFPIGRLVLMLANVKVTDLARLLTQGPC